MAFEDINTLVPLCEVTGASKYKIEPSINDNIVSVKATGVPNGCDVVVALYQNDSFIEATVLEYTGTDLTYTLTQDCDSVKIIVFEDIDTLEPLCDAVAIGV